MKGRIKWVLGIIMFIVISNNPIASWMIDSILGQDYYAYSNGDGTLTLWCGSFKETSYPNGMSLSLTKIDSLHTGEIEPAGVTLRRLYPNADTTIYRLFWKNPFKFWHWWQYISKDHKYDFPYKSWEEIEARRPKDFKRNNQYQHF